MTATGGMFAAASPMGSALITLNNTHGVIRVLTFGSGGVPASKSMPGGKRAAWPQATSPGAHRSKDRPQRHGYDDFYCPSALPVVLPCALRATELRESRPHIPVGSVCMGLEFVVEK